MAHSVIPLSPLFLPFDSRTTHRCIPAESPSLRVIGLSPLPPTTFDSPASRRVRAVVETNPRESIERCWKISTGGTDTGFSSTSSSTSSSSSAFAPSMKQREFGAFGTVTLEKGKLDMTKQTSKVGPQLADGSGGGNIGKQNNHGGGDGGDDGGDDDDYFGDFEEGDEGEEGGWFRRRLGLQELFDRKFLDAVLQEWSKTMMNLPSGLRQAYEMAYYCKGYFKGPTSNDI